MNTTGTSNTLSSSLTASRPEEPSASWMSARISPGFLFLASATASAWVRATPITLWPRFFTRLSRSIAMKVSSSMIRTSVAISAAISRPAASESLPRQRRDVRQPALRRQRQRRDVRVVVDRDRIPDLGEQAEQSGTRAIPLVEQRGILQQGLQHGPDISVTRSLISGQRTGIAPQQRQMFSNE